MELAPRGAVACAHEPPAQLVAEPAPPEQLEQPPDSMVPQPEEPQPPPKPQPEEPQPPNRPKPRHLPQPVLQMLPAHRGLKALYGRMTMPHLLLQWPQTKRPKVPADAVEARPVKLAMASKTPLSIFFMLRTSQVCPAVRQPSS